MRKFEQFFKSIAQVRSNVRGENGVVAKAIIGASIDNHRTLTLNQTVQYLLAIRKVKLAKQLQAVSEVIVPEIKVNRSNRTDAIDLSEFVNTYRNYVMNTKTLRRTVAAKLSKVV